MYKFKAEESYLPLAKTKGSAGMDVKTTTDIVLAPNQQQMVGTGVYITECAQTVYMELIIRSSLRAKGMTDLGTGVIDTDYRDEIKVILKNTSNKTITLEKGSRIAQLIPKPKVKIMPEYIQYNERKGGFGSTNK